MKQPLLAILLFAAAGICGCSAQNQPPASAERRPAGRAANAWSYASLSLPLAGQRNAAVWRTPDQHVVAQPDVADAGAEPSYAAAKSLYRKLSGAEAPQPFTIEIELFNLLGKRGWELAAIDADSAYKHYWFKRR